MNKNLPNVFANPLNKKIDNVQEIYYSKDKNINLDRNVNNVVNKINQIFSSSNHVYKSKVRITLNDREIIKEIVGKSNGSLLTIDGENINILDIIDIEKI